MYVRLEKINPSMRQKRFYTMRICQTLFGDWCLIREWGRIGSAGGQKIELWASSETEVGEAFQKLHRSKCKRGYVEIGA